MQEVRSSSLDLWSIQGGSVWWVPGVGAQMCCGSEVGLVPLDLPPSKLCSFRDQAVSNKSMLPSGRAILQSICTPIPFRRSLTS